MWTNENVMLIFVSCSSFSSLRPKAAPFSFWIGSSAVSGLCFDSSVKGVISCTQRADSCTLHVECLRENQQFHLQCAIPKAEFFMPSELPGIPSGIPAHFQPASVELGFLAYRLWFEPSGERYDKQWQTGRTKLTANVKSHGSKVMHAGNEDPDRTWKRCSTWTQSSYQNPWVWIHTYIIYTWTYMDGYSLQKGL